MPPRTTKEEKRERVLEFFYETQSVYTLKELEKLVAKEKSIPANTVEEVLKELLDDGLVDQEKRKRRLEALGTEVEEHTAKAAKLKAALLSERGGRDETAERTEVLAALAQQLALSSQYDAELATYASCDPALLKEKEKKTQIAKDAANRWTDNIFCIASWAKHKVSTFEQDKFFKSFGVPADLENID